ncbi:hypothetical protein [Gaopeijia maritima]|uniref:Uncharacterized protein n=1 Tax=Gaopeijia maritima TaxID=3119007 RepID=A0ABU9ECX1_9BACT
MKDQAEAFAVCLARGIVDPPVVGAWLDMEIGRSASPGIELIEASLAARDRSRLIAALHQIPGDFDPGRVGGFIFAYLRRAPYPDVDQAIRVGLQLHMLALTGLAPSPEAEIDMWSRDCDLERARGAKEWRAIAEEMSRFIDQYAVPVLPDGRGDV